METERSASWKGKLGLVHEAIFAQPILSTLAQAASCVLLAAGILPLHTLGHSIGEYGAMHATQRLGELHVAVVPVPLSNAVLVGVGVTS